MWVREFLNQIHIESFLNALVLNLQTLDLIYAPVVLRNSVRKLSVAF